MSDGSGSAGWIYDERGRVISETRQVSGYGTFVTSWGYNSADAVEWMQYPGGNNGSSGEVVSYGYYPQMSLASVSGAVDYVEEIQYDAAGRMVGLALGGTVAEVTYTYNPWNTQGGRMERIQAVANASSVLDLIYSYDPSGNITQIEDAVAGSPQTQNFEYDALDRLTYAEAVGGTDEVGDYSESYGYDPDTGNLANKADLAYTYGDSNHAHAVTQATNGSTITNTYTYDANGNMTQRVVGGSTYNLAYDAENHLIGVSGAYTATFSYDGDGVRVLAVENGSARVFIGNYYEWEASSGTAVQYYYAGALRAAMKAGDGSRYWLVGDHLGSTSVALDGSGNEVGRRGYTAWGDECQGRIKMGSSPIYVNRG